MSLVDTVGFVSGIFTIVGFFQTNFPGSAPEGAKVQIKAGLGDDNSSELGGQVQAVYGFDTGNNFIGESGSGSMSDGGITELTIDQDTPGIQADYLAGRLEDDSEFRPKCAWLDGDHTNDITNAALKFRVRAYGEEAEDTVNNDQACGSTLFFTETGPISGQPAKRDTSVRKAWMEDTIIISNFTDHSAEGLCNSDSSCGPDFVGPDGKFCDMATKTLSPLCSTANVDGCVGVDAESTTVTKRSTVARRSVNTVHKSYGRVSQWDN
ncbi:hypothetical protein M409DRAFT_19004 [Zasmidium cellare ATCC 36951]|uniref:Uncharacterized protein n=1 Tax=Zasmidium cellare ATCC 36951 TaxID=1080233 RepID=A0A6A6CV95_ZASCE|nr:uncharacterized protein M409DRAFT_19004 [Zasmidium cellare ATCC 36951]KAF2171031.1 hypothetical protein M409DRAFT_19004 [Zasmidium cellare ATCC 36951]